LQTAATQFGLAYQARPDFAQAKDAYENAMAQLAQMPR
jgi:hypothetical protein